jgi:hypothetical protein
MMGLTGSERCSSALGFCVLAHLVQCAWRMDLNGYDDDAILLYLGPVVIRY